jgi:hypothetical protein
MIQWVLWIFKLKLATTINAKRVESDTFDLTHNFWNWKNEDKAKD